MTDDHSRNGRRVVCAHEDTTRDEGVGIVGGHEGERRCPVGGEAEKTNSVGVVRVASGIDEADLGTVAGQGPIRVQKRGVACGTRHGSIISVGEDRTRIWIVGLGQASKQETLGVNRRYI
jgi:hypothetical protein